MFEKVTQKLTQSVCNNDGENLANLFAEQGIIMIIYMDFF